MIANTETTEAPTAMKLKTPTDPAALEATSRVKTLRIHAAGTLETDGGPWAADVRRIARPPRAGYVYLKMTEASGSLTTVQGPFFATDLPVNTTGVFYFPIAVSDGAGGIDQLHTGDIQWHDAEPGPPGTGLAWVALTQAAYDALSPPDGDTIYDITDAPWSP